MKILRQATAVTIKLGPFVDEVDHYTPDTTMTITAADVKLSKMSNFDGKNESSSATHDEYGYYDVDLDTTDTSTVGVMVVEVTMENTQPLRDEYAVIPGAIYDALISGSDYLDVQVAGMDNDVITAAAFDESTAYPLKQTDESSTALARTGLDSDTLESLSDQMDLIARESQLSTSMG